MGILSLVEAKIGKSRGQAGGWIVTVARAQEGNRINEMCHGALAESVASALEVGKVDTRESTD